jgi:hypothetical protein
VGHSPASFPSLEIQVNERHSQFLSKEISFPLGGLDFWLERIISPEQEVKTRRSEANHDLLDALKMTTVQGICDPQDAAQETDDPLVEGRQRGVVQMV